MTRPGTAVGALLCAAFWGAAPPAPGPAGAPGESTPPVIAMGLFPLGGGAGAWRIASERMEIVLERYGCRVRREYRIRRPGPERPGVGARADTAASALLGPDFLSGGIGRAARASVNGKPVPVAFRSGRLADLGSRVAMERKSEAEILDCWEHNVEGDVCGHTWVQFALPPGREASVTLEYDFTAGPQGSLEFALNALQLYTEKFWAGDRIGSIELRLKPVGWNVPVERFRPKRPEAERGRALAGSAGIAGSAPRISKGALVWTVRDYRPAKTAPGGNAVPLVDPDAVDTRAILDALERGR